MNVLCFGAHPDDIELCCGGTLTKYAKQGHNVFMAVATNGDKGVAEIPPKEMAEIRKKEAADSANVIGAELLWLGLEDEALYETPETRMKFVDAIRQARPDVIICPDPVNDYHIDHQITGRVVFEAASVAFVRQVKSNFPETNNMPSIYYCDTAGGVGFTPDEYVDISSEIETKIEMLKKHESQTKVFGDKKGPGIDLIDVLRTVAKFRGIAAQVPYAEGFKRMNLWRRGTAHRILP